MMVVWSSAGRLASLLQISGIGQDFGGRNWNEN